MPRVRLCLKRLQPSSFFRFMMPDGSVGALPTLRLSVIANLSAAVVPGLGPSSMKAAFPDCILDTGSHLATVPEYIHSLLKPGIITPLPLHASMSGHARRVIVAGGTFPYRLGLLPLRLMDIHCGELDVELVAQFVEDRGALDHLPLILGLQGGLLEGRTLTARPDTAAPHGQSWLLEE